VHPEIGINVLNRFAENAKAYGKVETIPVVEGKRANMMIAPVNSNIKAKKETEQEGELPIE
jgi:translation initiation factor IF-3